MKYVLDASVGLKWVFEEPFSDVALKLRRDVAIGVHELIAPDVFLIEIAHSISKAHRQQRITEEQAKAFLADILSSPPELYSSSSLLPRAFALSLTTRSSLYDCMYVALADLHDCSVVTADGGVQKNFDDTPHVVHLSII